MLPILQLYLLNRAKQKEEEGEYFCHETQTGIDELIRCCGCNWSQNNRVQLWYDNAYGGAYSTISHVSITLTVNCASIHILSSVYVMLFLRYQTKSLSCHYPSYTTRMSQTKLFLYAYFFVKSFLPLSIRRKSFRHFYECLFDNKKLS